MAENVFIKKHNEKKASSCDACKGPLVWSDKRLICARTTCKLYGKFQMIKRPPS